MKKNLSSTKGLFFLFILIATRLHVLAQQTRNVDCDSINSILSPFSGNSGDYLLDNKNYPIEVIEWGKLDPNAIKNSMFKGKTKINVCVEFVVDTQGKIYCPRVIKSDNDEFNSLAIEIIEKSKFSPMKIQDRKIVSKTNIFVRFRPTKS